MSTKSMINQCAKTAIKPELWKKNDSNIVQEVLHFLCMEI